MTAQDATVFVVDDDPSVRRSVSRLMRSAGYDVRTFASGAKFLDQTLPQTPACAVLDMCMDDMTGLDVQEALRQKDRTVPVLFLSGQGTVSSATRSMKAGAEDFLEKPFRPLDLLAAVQRALEHDRASSTQRHEHDALQRRYEELTPREQEVMKLVVSGMLNKQVAAELGISEKTVKVHRARVMEKMHVESLAALVLIAERIGVVNQQPDWTESGTLA